MNEELETTREELQSVNEELITVNAELNDKINQLREINTHQRNLMDSMNSGLVFLNERLEIQLFNPIAGELLNLIHHDIGRPIHHFAANFDYAGFTEDCEFVLNTLKPINSEIWSTDGRWYVMEIYPYRTLDGDVAGLVVTFVDISEQKNMLNEIAREQHLYRTLASHLPNAVALLFDHDLRYIVVEGQALETFGMSSSSVEGKYLKDVVQEPENLEMLTHLYRATLNGESRTMELTRDDITFLVQTAPIYNEQGYIIYGLLIGIDISPRRKMELELERSAEIYRTLVEHWPDKAIFVFDHDLRYIFAGGEALRAGGFIADEIIGRTLFEVLVTERAEMYAPHYKAVFQGDRVEFTSALGERRYHNLVIPIRRNDGTILAGMVISTEIVGTDPR
jgi:two-component system CheB/CheR fusion protein